MIFLILFLGTILRLIGINQSFWLDETAQATISAQPLSSISWAADFQPPLFYFITHIWQSLGIHSEWFLRLPSVAIGVVTIFVVYKLVEETLDKKTALLSGLLLSISSYHMYFSQEYRMYGLLALLTTLSWYLLWKKRYAWYALCITAMVFTHYFAFLIIAGHILYITTYHRKTLPHYATWLALGLAPFILWLPTLMQQLNTAKALVSAWPTWSMVSGVTFWKFIPLLFAKFIVGMISPPKILYGAGVGLMAFVTGCSYLVIAQKVWQTRRLSANVGVVAIWLAVTVLMAWVSSLFIHANSIHRFVFVIPPFFILLAYGLLQQGANKIVRNVSITIVMFVLSLYSGLHLFDSHYHREDWKGAISYADAKLDTSSLALAEFTGPIAPMAWYTKKQSQYIGASTQQSMTTQSVGERLDNKLPGVKKVILFTYLFEISDSNRLVEKYLTNNEYKLVEEKDFRGVGIVRTYNK